MSRVIGITTAILFHIAILLFGGILFLHSKPTDEKKATLENVDLVDDQQNPKTDKVEKKEEVARQEKEEQPEIQRTEEVPDLKELAKLDAPAAAPALEAMSLSAIEDALNSSGESADGGFSTGSTSFSSGGVIGGIGKALADGAGGGDGVFAIEELDQPPRPIAQPAPSYPWELRKQRIEGTVTVLFVVDATGRVADSKVESSPHPGLDKAALDAVRQWKFEPAVRAGKKVPARLRVPLRFKAA